VAEFDTDPPTVMVEGAERLLAMVRLALLTVKPTQLLMLVTGLLFASPL
jgi:hypothetical protein